LTSTPRLKWLVGRPAILLCLLVVVLAGCGSSSGGQSGANATDGLKGKPIRLRVFAPVNTATASYPDAEAGAQAAADAINKQGGIHGRPIEVDFCNTQFEANAANACARAAVQDDVVAIVGHPSTAPETGVLPILQDAKIPDVGLQATGNPVEYTSPASWPLQSATIGAYLALPFAAEDMHIKRLAVVALDIPNVINEVNEARAAAKAAGLGVTLTNTIRVPLQGVTDYTPFAQQIRDSGADGVALILAPTQVEGVAKAIQSLGLKETLFSNGIVLDQSKISSMGSVVNGMILSTPFPPPNDLQNPGVKRYNAELDASGAGKDPSLRGLAGINAWLSVYAVADVAKRIHGDITHESLWNALPTTPSINLMGLLTWDPGSIGKSHFLPRLPATQFQYLKVQAGKIVMTSLKPSDPMAAVRAAG
jgi:ABC-type branched-subunit amino acid transport system substrate-binding protein